MYANLFKFFLNGKLVQQYFIMNEDVDLGKHVIVAQRYVSERRGSGWGEGGGKGEGGVQLERL